MKHGDIYVSKKNGVKVRLLEQYTWYVRVLNLETKAKISIDIEPFYDIFEPYISFEPPTKPILDDELFTL